MYSLIKRILNFIKVKVFSFSKKIWVNYVMKWMEHPLRRWASLSCVVHIFFIILFFFSTTFSKKTVIPSSVSVKAVTLKEIQADSQVNRKKRSKNLRKTVKRKKSRIKKRKIKKQIKKKKYNKQRAKAIQERRKHVLQKKKREQALRKKRIEQEKKKREQALRRKRELERKEMERRNKEDRKRDSIISSLRKGVEQSQRDSEVRHAQNKDRALKLVRYTSAVKRHIRRFWKLPQFLAEKNLTASVKIRANRKGAIVSATLYKSSKNEIFDNLLIQTVKKASPLPLPPKELNFNLEFEDIVLNFKD